MLEMLLMVGKVIAKLMGITNVSNVSDGGVKTVIADQRNYPNDIGNPILLVNGYPYAKSRITPESFVGSVASPMVVYGQSGNTDLNNVPLTGVVTGNVFNPALMTYEIAPLNPFTVAGANIA